MHIQLLLIYQNEKKLNLKPLYNHQNQKNKIFKKMNKLQFKDKTNI